MPTNIKIIHPRDFIRARPGGTLDLRASLELLQELVSVLNPDSPHEVLVDTRQANVRLSAAEIFEIAQVVAQETALASRKVGLLVPTDELADAEFFQLASRNRGAEVPAFTDFERAITWLILHDG